jgi:NADPH:quinone reductase-like Zn-dependent oxidoreductase
MRAWAIEGGFGIDRLNEITETDPQPGPSEVVVRVRAVSLNYRDLLVTQGAYDPKLKLPHVPCSDCAGEVVAVGPAVTRAKIGDRVTSSFAQRWPSGRATLAKIRGALGAPLRGVLATHAVLHEEGIAPAPAHLSDVAAATLPCAATTAWHALVDHGRLAAGESVLVQGTGGVSIFALQIAKMFGARVIATSSSPAKRERLRAMGAMATIDYKADADWGKTVRSMTGGVDHVVEVGGAGTLAQSLRAVAPGGTIHVIGVLGGAADTLDVRPVLMNEVRLQGVIVGPRESLEAVGRAFAANDATPIVDRVFPWAEAREALAYLESGAHFGKVCIATP